MPRLPSLRLKFFSRCARLSMRWQWMLILVLLVASQNGCVRRRLTVRSSPPGAQVFVDDQEIGSSPASTNFVYYGTRKITLIKDGYETQTVYERMFPPWYELPGLDLINETLNPWELRDERVVDIQLVPMQIVPEERLLDRADALRSSAATGQVTGLPGAVPGFTLPTAPPATPLPGLPGQGVGSTPPVGSVPLPPANYPQPAGSYPTLPIGSSVITPPRP